MNVFRKRPSAALVVATLALFVALGGTAGAVVSSAVPLAKRALVADNARKVGGQTASQIASQAAQAPGPASSAAGLISVKTAPWSLQADGYGDFQVTCDAGQKVVGGGWDNPGGYAHAWDDRPNASGNGWRMYITVSPNSPSSQTGTVYAVCVR